MINRCFDRNGHGTHVAGIIAADGKIKGVAPGAKIAAIQVCSSNGYCWSDEVAGYGLGSALPGRSGNSVIFAHAKKNLFLPLRNIKINDLIYVVTENNHWYSYAVIEKREVFPNQVEVIASTDDKILTLFTCSGFADTKRLIVRAKSL